MGLLTLLLVGCGSEAPVVAPRQTPAAPATALSPPSAPSGPFAWRNLPDAASFGPLTGAPLFSIRCVERTIEITRHSPSEPHAKAMLALIGNRQIARLPVDAAAGQEGARWVGRFAPADPRLDVFVGGGEIAATLPGGGRIVLAGSTAPGVVMDACREQGPFPPMLSESETRPSNLGR